MKLVARVRAWLRRLPLLRGGPRLLPPRGSRRRAALTWTGLVAVPLLIAGMLAWAFGNGLVAQGAATAAVVNHDQPVTVNGQTVPLGRQLAQTLVHGTDHRYRWVLTDDADAGQGLGDGEYAAVVTIPADFSRRTTSAATAKEPLSATKGVITVTTSPDAALADAMISQDVAAAATTATADQVVQTYLDNVYVGFTTLHGKIGDAADGARRIADGTDRASDGSRRLATGSGDLVVGLGSLTRGARQASSGATSLAEGARRLQAGATQLSSGATGLAAGTHELATGSTQLSSGLDTLRARTGSLPAQTRRLADGARQVADGNARLAAQVVPVARRAVDALDALPDVGTVVDRLQVLAAECRARPSTAGSTSEPAATAPSGELCDRLRSATAALARTADSLESRKAGVRSQIAEVRDGVTSLEGGAAQVALGSEQLAQAAPALAAGVASAAAAGHRLATGAARADAGAGRLVGGAGQLAAGAGTLAGGADRLAGGAGRLSASSAEAAAGARQVHGGATRLADGLGQVERGAGQLATGLAASRGQVPTYTAAQRDHLSEVAASPAYTEDGGRDVLSSVTGSFFAVLALWVGAMAVFVPRRAVPPGVLTSRAATLTLVARSVAPGAGVAATSGLLLGSGLGLFLGADPGRVALVALAAALAGGVFAVVNQGLIAVLGRLGRLAALAVLVVTATAGVLSTIPGAFKDLAGALPTHDAMAAVRVAATGGSGLVGPVLVLLAWAVGGLLVSAVVIERRRSVHRRALPGAPGDLREA